MSFKIKNRKKKTIDKRTTIDAKHKNIVKQFKDEQKKIPSLKKELNKLKISYNKLLKKDLKDLNDYEFKIKDELEDNIEILENKIKSLESSKEEKDYYLNTSSLLFDYYDTSLSNKIINKKNNKNKTNRTVMDWLNKNQSNTENRRQAVCDNYLALTDPNFVKSFEKHEKDSLICEKCQIEKKCLLITGTLHLKN